MATSLRARSANLKILTKIVDYKSTNYPDDAAIRQACRYLREQPLTPEQIVARDEYYLREHTPLPKR
jgi:hypothetical protein